jgi:alpha/beta superfamily hydrolase
VGKLETLAASLPTRPWLRTLDADHFFADVLDELATACAEAIRWAEG